MFSFFCYPKDAPPEWGQVINAPTASKARYEYWLDLSDSWPEYRLIDMRSRKVGLPVTSDEFLRTAQYRGVPFARCGMKVALEKTASQAGAKGIIVGHNSSANFDVYFTSGPHKGATMNCHPNWRMTYFDERGKVIHKSSDN